MYVTTKSFVPYGFIPTKCAFGKHDPATQFTFAGNRNPHLAWGDVPEGTESIAVIAYDTEVPSSGEHVNQAGVTVPVALPRTTFFHWVLLDLPANLREIGEGMHSLGITRNGKQNQSSPDGGVAGINDYTDWFAGDESMKGNYYGYDGPAPPWNDERVHAYTFTVFALNVRSLGMHGSFNGHKAMRALRSHVLSQASIVGLYAINPDARAAHLATLSDG
jgi:Raf kinase inhibitor-like YbhB/YbcL family protein